MDKRKLKHVNRYKITAIINNCCLIGWFLFVILFIWFIYIKDSLINPNSLDIRILTGIILIEIVLVVVKRIFQSNIKVL